MKKLLTGILALTLVLSVLFMGAVLVSAEETNAAKIGDTEYATLEDAVEAATAGQTIVLLRDVTLTGGYEDAAEALRIEKAITIDGKGHTINCGNYRKGIRLYNEGSAAKYTFTNVTIINNAFQGRCIDTRTGNINLVLNGVTLTAEGTNSQPLTIGGEAALSKVTVDDTIINAGKSGYGIITFVQVNELYIKGNSDITGFAALYVKGNNSKVYVQQNTKLTGINDFVAESGGFGTIVLEGNKNSVIFDGNNLTVTAAGPKSAHQSLFNIRGEGNKIRINGTAAELVTEGNAVLLSGTETGLNTIALTDKSGSFAEAGFAVDAYNKATVAPVAKADELCFASLLDAIACVPNDAVITLLDDVTLENTVLTINKNITIDFNGHTVTGKFGETTSNSEVNGSLVTAVTQFVLIENAEVTLKDSVGTGGLDADVAAYGNLSNLIRVATTGKLTIESGNYHQNLSVVGAGMIDSRGSNNITVKGGNFKLDNVGTQSNGSPWIFNTSGRNSGHINVLGGTFNADVFHQYYVFEVQVPDELQGTLALSYDEETDTYTVVEAVAYVVEKHGNFEMKVGYATIEEANAACDVKDGKVAYRVGTYYASQKSEGEEFGLLQDINLDGPIVIS